jgi:hypothetical protein
MVKNSGGGGNAKKQGRKFQQSNSAREEMRRVSDPMEKYGLVLEMRGGKLFKALVDGEERICHMGGKFRGRNKRGNYIEKGVMVIVGVREWCAGGDVDLLYVYEREEGNVLKRELGVVEGEEEEEEEERGYEFVSEVMTEREKSDMIKGRIKRVEEERTEIKIEEL